MNHPPSGNAFGSRVETHHIEGINVRVYSAAKSVADCFKFRNKIGADVVLEALRDYRRNYRSGMDELWRYAKLARHASDAAISGVSRMSPAKPKNLAASVRQRLVNLSQQRGEEFQFILEFDGNELTRRSKRHFAGGVVRFLSRRQS